MLLELCYTIPDAKSLSQKSNIIPLYVLQMQGKHFSQDTLVNVSGTNTTRFYAGFSIAALEPNVIAVVVPITNPNFMTLTTVNSMSIMPVDRNIPVYMDAICHGGSTIIKYGQHLANLYFIPLVNIHSS